MATLLQTTPRELRLAALFSDGLVLQREATAPIWGWAEPGREVRVRASWGAAEAVAKADASGRWRAELRTPSAGGPHTLSVRAEREIAVRDVLVGEVWLCSGQSNMEWKLHPGELGGVMDAEREIAAADHPRIRHFDVANTAALSPREDCDGRWAVCSPETVGEFSAVGYFFARELERELGVPVGVVNASWSGTRIEAWLDEPTVAAFAELAADRAALAALAAAPPAALDPQTASVLFNGMIAPLAPFGVRGFLWYQGEANRDNFALYRRLQPALVERWRALFGGGPRPFYYVQIAPYAYEGDAGQTGALRDVQRQCLSQEATGMVSTLDIGDPADIHPANKQEVGRRLALWALARTYGREQLVHSGPLYRETRAEGAALRVFFDHVGEGLISGGDHLTGFEVAGDDRRFFRAQARIEGDSVVVSSPQVPSPVAVRYGFGAAVQPILFNKSWLPAAAFRSDAWPIP